MAKDDYLTASSEEEESSDEEESESGEESGEESSEGIEEEGGTMEEEGVDRDCGNIIKRYGDSSTSGKRKRRHHHAKSSVATKRKKPSVETELEKDSSTCGKRKRRHDQAKSSVATKRKKPCVETELEEDYHRKPAARKHLDKELEKEDKEEDKATEQEQGKMTVAVEAEIQDLEPQLPDTPAQDLHCMMQCFMTSYKAIQDAGGFPWDLHYKEKYMRFSLSLLFLSLRVIRWSMTNIVAIMDPAVKVLSNYAGIVAAPVN